VRISEIAMEVWKDSSFSKRLKDEAQELKQIFNERFWMEDRGCYALALDKGKRQVDALTSNNGQLLWSGIVVDREKRVDLIAEKLLNRDRLFSGYRVRTLSRQDKGYSPIGYHNGCVWAHDNSLIAEGLARYEKTVEANVVIDSMLSAGPHFGYTMPETFAGFPRLETGFPVRYPTSSSPQSVAAGASLLFLRTLLGLRPLTEQRSIIANPIFREKGTSVELEGIEAFGKKYTIRVSGGSKTDIRCESKRKRSASN
jgi:glycogen debranching enzyme